MDLIDELDKISSKIAVQSELAKDDLLNALETCTQEDVRALILSAIEYLGDIRWESK